MRNLNGIKKWSSNCKLFNPNMSASKLNLFRADLPMFIMKYGFGHSSQYSPAANRGLLVETAVKNVLLSIESIEQAILTARKSFVEQYYLLDVATEKEYLNLEAYICLSVEALKSYGVPKFDKNNEQEKISFMLTDEINDWEIPMVGYLDFVFPEINKIIDLKTTNKMQRHMSFEHKIQRAIYKTAKKDYDIDFLYITPKKADFKNDGINEEEKILNYIKSTVNMMNNFCDHMTPEMARKSIPLNTYSIYWRDNHELQTLYQH